MKNTIFTGLVAACIVCLAGCATSGTHSEVAEQFKSFQEAVAQRPPQFVMTGERSLDDVGVLSAQVYGSMIKYLDEYVKATENNRYYIGFMGDVADVAKEKKISVQQAMVEVLNEYKKSDETAAPDKKVFPRVVEGYNAVLALKPANKLRELAPIAVQAAKVALQAQKVGDTVKKTYSSINFRDVKGMQKKVRVTAALAKILEQTAFTTRALDFLQDQYKRNQEMVNYMK